MLKIPLIISGILAALALIFPSLIIIGYILFFIPGLILSAMPTIFLYLLATFLIRLILPIENDWIANALALAIAIGVASLAVQPLRIKAENEFIAAQVPDIVPQEKLALSGDVVIEKPGSIPTPNLPVSCDALCLAILDLPDVSSITMVAYGHTATFAFAIEGVDASDGEALDVTQPYDPGRIAELLDYPEQWEATEEINRIWEDRLAGPERLVRIATPAQFDWTLVDDNGSTESGPTMTRAVIRDKDGTTRLNRGTLYQSVPTAPPYLAFTAGGADTGFAPRGFRLSSRPLSDVSAGWTRADKELAQALVLRDVRER